MTHRARLKLSEEERNRLEALSRSRIAAVREVERAKILLRYADGVDLSAIAREVGVTRMTPNPPSKILKSMKKPVSTRIW
jgi:hypothetical protein